MTVSEEEIEKLKEPIILSIRFAWEALKIMIELLKMNGKMLKLYSSLCLEVQ
jgi:hypothetical protein